MPKQPKTATGIWLVKVWLVLGYNTDSKDLAIGGSRLLGPYMPVLEDHQEAFVAAMQRQFGKDPRVQEIRIEGRQFVPRPKSPPTLRQELARFRVFLDDPAHWVCYD